MDYTRKTRDVWRLQVRRGRRWETDSDPLTYADALEQWTARRALTPNDRVRIVFRREPLD